jgi:hypothetical protein
MIWVPRSSSIPWEPLFLFPSVVGGLRSRAPRISGPCKQLAQHRSGRTKVNRFVKDDAELLGQAGRPEPPRADLRLVVRQRSAAIFGADRRRARRRSTTCVFGTHCASERSTKARRGMGNCWPRRSPTPRSAHTSRTATAVPKLGLTHQQLTAHNGRRGRLDGDWRLADDS